jgi:hypothetical protein
MIKKIIYLQFFIIFNFFLISCSGQKPDLDYDTRVKNPAYTIEHPKVLFDEAHNNFHTAGGRYAPFVNLISHDGFTVDRNREAFSGERLSGYSILVISNAEGKEKKYQPAFTEEECSAVQDWVRNGGGLLLIADHYPMGSAAQSLAKRFDVEMGNGYVSDSMHYEGDTKWKDQLVFSRENGLLKTHPITEGRISTEQIRKVVTFTGQSLTCPPGGTTLLDLSSSATESVPDSIWTKGSKTFTRFTDPIPVAGKCQGLALQFGKGRVVILGEAAMLTAQIDKGKKFGMNIPGNDNRQFTLNLMHWLSGLLP